jgi:hypothetical protein
MKIDITAVIVALITVALVSLIGIVGLLQINNLVFQDLYEFGLVFSNRWAMPFWTYSGIIVGLSWVNIGAATALTYHVFRRRKPVTPGELNRVEVPPVNQAQHRLADYFKILESKSDSGTTAPLGSPVTSQWSTYNVRQPAYIVDSQC